MCERWQSKDHIGSGRCEGWCLLMAFCGPGSGLNTIHTPLIFYAIKKFPAKYSQRLKFN